MKIESISCQVRTARKQHLCELCLCPIHKDEFQTEDYGLRYTSETFYRAVCDYIHLHHNGDDSWTGSMFSRVTKILNEVNN